MKVGVIGSRNFNDYELVKDNMVLYIYLDKYKSKKQVEDGPYGFYIINKRPQCR